MMCKYKDCWSEKYKNYNGSEYCIFHYGLKGLKIERDEYGKVKEVKWIDENIKKEFESEEFKEKFKAEFREYKNTGSKFNGFVFPEISFEGENFVKEAIFSDAIFTGNVNFSKATFYMDAIFSDAIFLQSAYFENVTFREKALFIKTEFPDKTKEKALVSFRYAVFYTPKNVIFESVNLERCSFLNCRLKDVVFSSDCKFNFCPEIIVKKDDSIVKKISAYIEKIGFDRAMVLFDELILETEEKNAIENFPELVADECREFRKNYEEALRYFDADSFYIGEMEIRRKYNISKVKRLQSLKNNTLHKHCSDKIMCLIEKIARINHIIYRISDKTLTTLYKYSSFYGENYTTPLWWIICVVIVYGIYYSIKGVPDGYRASLFTFVQMPPEELKNSIAALSERIIAVILTTLLVLALRRKFKKY